MHVFTLVIYFNMQDDEKEDIGLINLIFES